MSLWCHCIGPCCHSLALGGSMPLQVTMYVTETKHAIFHCKRLNHHHHHHHHYPPPAGLSSLLLIVFKRCNLWPGRRRVRVCKHGGRVNKQTWGWEWKPFRAGESCGAMGPRGVPCSAVCSQHRAAVHLHSQLAGCLFVFTENVYNGNTWIVLNVHIICMHCSLF